MDETKRSAECCHRNKISLFRLARRMPNWLEESDHVITLGPEREEVFVLSREFMTSPPV